MVAPEERDQDTWNCQRYNHKYQRWSEEELRAAEAHKATVVESAGESEVRDADEEADGASNNSSALALLEPANAGVGSVATTLILATVLVTAILLLRNQRRCSGPPTEPLCGSRATT